MNELYSVQCLHYTTPTLFWTLSVTRTWHVFKYRWLYCAQCPHNIAFCSKRLDICAHAVYSTLHPMMPNVTCLRLNDASVINRVTYLQFPTAPAPAGREGACSSPQEKSHMGGAMARVFPNPNISHIARYMPPKTLFAPPHLLDSAWRRYWFPIPRRSARRHSAVLGLPNIGHRTSPKIWGSFLYRPEKWL